MVCDKYFKAKVKDRRGEQHTLYGVAFCSMGQTPKSEAEHIALVRGFGTSKVTAMKIFQSGKTWYEAQYGKEKPRRKNR